MPSRPAVVLLVCFLLLAGAVVARIQAGGPIEDVPQGAGEGNRGLFKNPIVEIRAQRAAAGVVVGGALAVAGVMLQCLFRNPLASPDLLGMASGAGLGVMAAAYVGFRTTSAVSEVGLGATGPPALFGALAALGLTYLFSQRRGFIDPPSLLLVGVIVGVMAASLTQFIQYLMPDRGMSAGRWLLGAIGDDISWRQSAMVGAVVVAVAIVTGRLGPWMDAATLGDDEARSVGVRLGWLRSWLFTGSAVLAASAVVLAGPIAFVGLICPHLVRLAAGPSHRALIVGSAMAGGALVVWADTMVRTIELPSGRLPISVLTSLIGGPLLIVILRRREPLA